MKNVLIFNQITLLRIPFLEVVSEFSSAPSFVKSVDEIVSSACGVDLDLAFIHADDHLYQETEIIALIRALSPSALIVLHGRPKHGRYLKAGAQLFFDNFMTVDEMKSQLASWFKLSS